MRIAAAREWDSHRGGGPAPTCREARNTNADDRVDISDGVFLLNHLFLVGPRHPPVACEGWAGVDCEAFSGFP